MLDLIVLITHTIANNDFPYELTILKTHYTAAWYLCMGVEHFMGRVWTVCMHIQTFIWLIVSFLLLFAAFVQLN